MIQDFGFDLNPNNLPKLLDLLEQIQQTLHASSRCFDAQTHVNPSLNEILNLVYMGEFVREQFVTFAAMRRFLDKMTQQLNALTIKQQSLVAKCRHLLVDIEQTANSMRMCIHDIKQKLGNDIVPLENFIREKMRDNFNANDLMNNPEKLLQQFYEFVKSKIASVSLDTSSYYTPITSTKTYHLTDNIHRAHQKIIKLFNELYKYILFSEPPAGMHATAAKLGLLQGDVLLLDTEYEQHTLLDISFFQYRVEGKNIAERYYEKNHAQLQPDILELLNTYKDAHFCLLDFIKFVPENSLVVYDRLQQKEVLLIDKNLYQLSQQKPIYPFVILTHYFCLPEFAMSTGAAIPLPIQSPITQQILGLFDKLVQHHRNKQLLSADDYSQVIIDIFKITFREGIIRNVPSKLLPFGQGSKKAYSQTLH